MLRSIKISFMKGGFRSKFVVLKISAMSNCGFLNWMVTELFYPRRKTKSLLFVCNVQCPVMKSIDSIVKNYITKQSNESITAKMRQQMIS